MRLLIFLLALSSAFFVPYSKAIHNPDTLVEPESTPSYTFECTVDNNYKPIITSQFNSVGACQEYWLPLVIAYADRKVSDGFWSTYSNISFDTPNKWSLDYVNCRYGDCDTFGVESGIKTSNGQYNGRLISTDWKHECPPTNFPKHKIGVPKIPQPTEPSSPPMFCGEPLDDDGEEPEPDPDDNCPAPTDNDPFIFGTGGGSREVCFNNPDGTQCKIKTGDDGGYYMPVSYGSQEPATCAIEPEDPVDPEPEPDDPTDPEPEDPTDPNPTPDPEDRPDPEDTDNTDKTEVLEAMNQVNDNLDAINNNMLDGIESHEQRLDRMAEETQTSNELLAAIKDEIGNGNNTLKRLKSGQDKGNSLLEDIKKNTKKDKFDVKTTRKNPDKGLNGIFTDADLAEVTQEIDDKKIELKDYFDQIESETKALFDINPALGGGYEERMVTIKGVEVDMGLGRLSEFFQMIAAAILLVASLTALYILLGP
ncbi:hypothetical protein [Pseudoalteromonas sp. H105]|uniref:hypothetical protein n=1 Tax=Pseudoalteromonas sp. H105 TaxID=1348393 RepID=UPI000731F71E|nr:hypothetical protein [Pseudoalteromonas sp. H105]KTF16890.1 hypothetical protein ATS75_05450 [Pseudoalteromonas sp. H105]